MAKGAVAPAALAIWDMQPGETSKAYEAFRQYRDLGVTRSLSDVSAMLHKSVTVLGRWSRANRWVERAAAFDAEVSRRVSAASIDTHAEVLIRQAEQAREIGKRAYSRLTVLESRGDAGNPVIVEFDPLELTPAEAGRLWKDAVKEEREALGIGQRVEVSGPDGKPVEHVVSVVIDLGDDSRMRADDDDG